jgi:hypothetical protein
MSENQVSGNSVPHTTTPGILWKGSPSVFHYAGSYLLTLVVIYIIHQIQLILSPEPYELVVVYAQWSRPLSEWSMSDWPLLVITLGYLIMLVMIAYCLFQYFRAKMTVFKIENDQISVRKLTPFGIVEQRTELYRLVDFMKSQSFVDTFFGLSTLRLRSSDVVTPVVRLYGVRHGAQVLSLIRDETEKCRIQKGVREITSPGAMAPLDRN